tara:strand:- start:621 stop:1568 length:948 start_codon:yes stop_codon:yes gene_type:complete
MLRAGLLSLILILSGCASVPRFTETPQNCNPEVVDVVTAVETAMPFECNDAPEIVRLPAYTELLNLPPAEKMPVVAVYKFLDKTGQRKRQDNIASFSTAVSQGATEMLIDALKTAGGGTWFRVVERQGIDHLVRERQIVRSTREEFDENGGIAPLLFAGMIIEGGVIGYDTNVMSGGRGARTLGIGYSRQYRKDVVTISIRAVSVLTGEVLLNVQSKKTILSTGGGFDVFKFVDMDTQLVEIEDGVGENESVTYATRAAIEAAVLELIYQGHERGFWKINWPEGMVKRAVKKQVEEVLDSEVLILEADEETKDEE